VESSMMTASRPNGGVLILFFHLFPVTCVTMKADTAAEPQTGQLHRRTACLET
jgi:hypothetical protein